MRKKLLLIISLFGFVVLSAVFAPRLFATDQYSCQNWSGHCLTSFAVDGRCDSNHHPYMHFSWTNQFGDSSFNIVYSRSSTGHWYQFHTGATSADVPPTRGDNGDAGADSAGLVVGERFSAKITGGYPKWLGGSGITTGYTDPDKSDTVPDCTPQPTATPTPAGPTATPTPGPHTNAKVVLFFPAVGGKNGGNASPGRPTRNITLYFYRADQDPTDPSITPITKTGTVHLDGATGSQTYGYFINAAVDLGGFSGTYKVLVKSNQYLRKQFIPKNGDSSQTYVFTAGQTAVLPTITLIAGDLSPAPTTAGGSYGDNTLDISDYNMLARQCYGGKSSCPNKEGADLNDDSKIDGIDYNILLRSFNILLNEGSQGGDGE